MTPRKKASKKEIEVIVHPPETIRSRRIDLRMSQAELAGLANMSREHLCAVERGFPGVRYSTLKSLQQALEKEEKRQAQKVNRLVRNHRPSTKGKKGAKG